MRVVVQRAVNARCIVDGKTTGEISDGFMLLVGFTQGDSIKEIQTIAKKIAFLRIFEDENGKLNKSIKDINGSILAISQFTLYGDCKKGNRPSFTEALAFNEANHLFDLFVLELKKYEISVKTGIFGADMQINFTNVGPTTIWLDSKYL